MKKVIKRVKKGLAALLAGITAIAAASVATVMAEESEKFELHHGMYSLLYPGEDVVTLHLDVEPELQPSNPELGSYFDLHVIPVGTTLDIAIYGARDIPYMVSVYEYAFDEGIDWNNPPLFYMEKPPGRSSIPDKATYIFDAVGIFALYVDDPGGSSAIYLSVVESAPTSNTASAPTRANDQIAVTINGAPVNFADQQPANIDGRILVPVRGVFETLGFEASWNPDLEQATLLRANDAIVITIGSATFTTNGASHTLDVPAQAMGGRTMIPLRAVLESVGYDLDWDEDTRTVVITTK